MNPTKKYLFCYRGFINRLLDLIQGTSREHLYHELSMKSLGDRRWSEAVVHWCSVKKVFLEISQNSQENTCARVSFLIKLQLMVPQTYIFL